MIKSLVYSTVFVLAQLGSLVYANPFPIGPDQQVTPGDLCQHPDQLRYPEKINYCDRNVSTALKNQIIQNYDHQFNYSIEQMDRNKFKIDHFIPLCAGGSNDIKNLWPQHESVYTITDPLEDAICVKMSEGKLKQSEAIEIIKKAKLNLTEAPSLLKQVLSM